jgi:hypothetical protein
MFQMNILNQSSELKSKLAACFILVSCLSCPASQKMDVIYSSETSVNFKRTTWLHIPEDEIPESKNNSQKHLAQDMQIMDSPGVQTVHKTRDA